MKNRNSPEENSLGENFIEELSLNWIGLKDRLGLEIWRQIGDSRAQQRYEVI